MLLEEMKASILELPGVKTVELQINDTWSFDHYTQITRKSFRLIVEGGKKKAIAQVIWQYKRLGVLALGNTSVIVKGIYGFKHTINFEKVK